MITTKNSNGTTYKFTNKLFVFQIWYCFNTYKENRKNFLFQLNKFENGYCNIYLRLFKKYSFYINNIRLKQGKCFFLGNKE